MPLFQDLRTACRSLVRRPGFSITAVLTLALGLGTVAVLYSVAHSVLLEPLPYRDSSRLLAVFSQRGDTVRQPMAPADVFDLAERSSTVGELAAAHPWGAALTGLDVPERIPALRATPNVFELLGVEAELGRTFRPAEGTPGQDRVVVLSWDLFERRFGGDTGWVGRTIRLDGEPHQVIGVMPRGFGFPPFWASDAEMWAPLALDAEARADRQASYLRGFARVAPGVSPVAARRELAALGAELAAEHPGRDQGFGIHAEPLLEPVVGDARGALLGLLAGGLLLYLIAGTNIVGLFVARRVGRAPEMAVRAALGAGRGQLLRPWLLEALLLAAAGCAVGVLLALWGIEALQALAPADLPRRGEIGLGTGTVALAAALAALPALVAATLAGLGGRPHPPGAADARSVGGGARLRGALVAGQVALASALLLAAAVTAHQLSDLMTRDPGFERHGVLTASLSLAASPQGEPERQAAFFHRVLDEAGSLPGVTGAALVNHLPVGADEWGTRYRVGENDAPVRVVQRVTSPDYLQVVGLELLAGRAFNPDDRAGGPAVALVNQTLAQRLAADPRQAVGELLRPDGDGTPRRVVGVVADSAQSSVARAVGPEVLLPYSQNPYPWFRQTTLVLALDGAPESLGEELRSRMAKLAPAVPLFGVRTMDRVLAQELAGERWAALLLIGFSSMALVLAAVGLYGVLAFLVGHRRREIALRLVLGASRGRLLGAVVRRGVALAAAGLVVGLTGGVALLTAALQRWPMTSSGAPLEAMPAAAAAVAALVLLTAGLAAALPARRALSRSPMVGLRDGG